jgi:peptidoglycan hydrolase CwlO-like protein
MILCECEEHETVVHEDHVDCPVCTALDRIEELETASGESASGRVEELEEQVEELEAQVEELEAQIVDLEEELQQSR